MQKQKIILLIGIVLAVVSAVMVKVYVDQQRLQVQEQAKKAIVRIQENQSAVLVANKDIPRGAVIAPEMLETAIVPNQYVQPQAATSLDRISGMITLAPISKGEQINLSKLAYPKQASSGQGLAAATPVGKRAVTISVDNIASLAGMIKPGDYVDVIAIVPIPVQTKEGKQAQQAAVMSLFQNVLVLAVGQDTGAVSAAPEGRYVKEEKREASPLITLSLGPTEASLIAFVQEQGKIRLLMRSPADSQIEPVQMASWDSLFQYVMPTPSPAVPKPETKPTDEAKPTGYVEIYRGMSKEKMPLYK